MAALTGWPTLLLAASGCAGSALPVTWLENECIPGAAETCACLGGLEGAQTCLDSGTYSECACPEGSAPAGLDAGSLDTGGGGEEVSGPVDSGGTGPGPTSDAVTGEDSAAPDPGYVGPWLRITEFMAANRGTLLDEDGDSSDWLEIYNPSDASVALVGFHLTDTPDQPGRWTFPMVELEAKGFLVVFASGKDRTDPEGPLHTNFKLSAGGEYLSLVAPDGTVIDTHSDWPPQVSDVSYGQAMAVTDDPLVSPTAIAQYLMPYGEAPDPSWTTDTWIDAESDWSLGALGLGYEGGVFSSLEEPTADTLADWSYVGSQGENSWRYGYYDATQDTDGYQADDFVSFPPNFWDGEAWDWPDGDPPWTYLGQSECHPAGENNGSEHWVIRRWEAELPGTLIVQWKMAKAVTGGNGVRGQVIHEGVVSDEASIGGGSLTGVDRSVFISDVQPGDRIDFAVTPRGNNGNSQDGNDQTNFSATVWLLPSFAPMVGTELPGALLGGGSLYLRVPFQVEDPSAYDYLTLGMWFDDGFAAWINGAPLASSNAPEELDWSSSAVMDRPENEALIAETWVLGEAPGVLVEGMNVLAIQALNASAADDAFLVRPSLRGESMRVLDLPANYLGVPTPGAPNIVGDVSVAPIIAGVSTGQHVEDMDPIVVEATVVAAQGELVEAILHYRIGFGPEQVLGMMDQGDDRFAGQIPASLSGPGDLVRWYVTATDDSGNTTRYPPFLSPTDSEQYMGTVVHDPTIVTNLPLYQWFTDNPNGAKTDGGSRGALFYQGELYDNMFANLHGQSTKGMPKKSYNVDFTSDHRFLLRPGLARMKDINLLTNYADKSRVRNTVAWEVFGDVGQCTHLAEPVRLHQNGQFIGVYDMVEDGDDIWLDRCGLDGDGALYKMYNTFNNVNGAQKKSRKDEGNADLQAFISGLNAQGDDLRNFIYDHVSVPGMVNYMAGVIATGGRDCGHKNYYVYRDTMGNGEWWFLPWDQDLTFGHTWTQQHNYYDDWMYFDHDLYMCQSNKLVGILFAMDDFWEMYTRRVRTVLDGLLQPPGTPYHARHFEARVDAVEALIGDDAIEDIALWGSWGDEQTVAEGVQNLKDGYLEPRRQFMYLDLPESGGGPLPWPQPPSATLTIAVVYPSLDAPEEAYIALSNPSSQAVDISGWQLAGDIDFTFRSGTVVTSGGVIYVSPNVVAFRAREVPPTGGMGLFVVGDWTGVLSEIPTIELITTDGALDVSVPAPMPDPEPEPEPDPEPEPEPEPEPGDAPLNCAAILAADPLSPSGPYWVDLDGVGGLAPMQATCDMTTDGGGWTLVLNYLHAGGSNPALQVRTSDLPVQGGDLLGLNESASPYWGHASNSLLAAASFGELMFYCENGSHPRVIHFKTDSPGVIDYVTTGLGSMAGVYSPSTSTNLSGYDNATLPLHTNGENSTFSDQGDIAMTEFPFYSNSGIGNPRAHWGIRGLGNRWECDDFGGSDQSHTLHRIWIR